MTHEIQWYDSVWLSKYLAAKEFIETNYPEKLALLDAHMP